MIDHISYECPICGLRVGYTLEMFQSLKACPVCEIPLDREPTSAELERAKELAVEYQEKFVKPYELELVKIFGEGPLLKDIKSPFYD